MSLLALAVSSAVLSMGAAQAQDSVPASAAENGNPWFVELSGAPVADGSSPAAVRNEKAAFRRAAAAAGSALDLAAAVALTGANIAQNQLGLTGRGIKVGIIDTGIDIDHPAFGSNGTPGSTGFPSARVTKGYDEVGDNYNSSGTAAQHFPVPDANPDDRGGHGTHVAGIAGANGGGLKGVAPEVELGADRVFGCTGTSSSDVIVEALERAYADGRQVINQCLGAARQWPQYPTAQDSSRLVNKGVVMVASIGNNGPGGSSPDALSAAGAPGVGDKVIGVASYDNAQRSFTVGGTPYGHNAATGAPLPPSSGSLPMSKTGVPAGAASIDACSPLPAGSLTGTAALIQRGGCAFYLKAFHAQSAGAAAVVICNNAAGAVSPTVAGSPPITIPVVVITQAQGITLNNLIAAGPTALTWTGDYVGYPYGTGGLISGFSSFGLTAELGLKPNIGAPGGAIFSAYPLELGGAATLSGTSMSAPHVAGGAALILQGRPNMNPRTMMARMQSEADPKNWSGNAALGFLDFSFRQGAGMLDIVGTVQSTASVEPSQISLGESEAGSKTTTITVKNEGNTPVTYDLSHVASLASGPNVQAQLGVAPPASYNTTGTFNAPATAVLSAPSITVAPGGSAKFDVTLTANASLPDRSLYGGYVVMTPQGGGNALRVPYAGFKGDYQSTVVLTSGASGFPVVGRLNAAGTSYALLPTGGVLTMQGNDIPFFLLHLDHHSRRVRLEVNDAITGKSWHRVSDDEYVSRNSTPNGFFAFAWDGTSFTGKGKNANQWYTAPNGSYKVTVKVLKALGDENNPAHWETWASPTVTIARP